MENLHGSDYKENAFLIDWLTFVAHGLTVEDVKHLLGLSNSSIPWDTQKKYRNGYPMQCYWEGITISFGADDEQYLSEGATVRDDMGICVNLSGTGCRSYESYGSGDWLVLFSRFFSESSTERFNVTRLDIAFDDHTGILDIKQLEYDTRHRNYISRSTYTEIVWSDNQDTGLEGLCLNFGSPKSLVKTRIYDKAAERGYKDLHWIRVELQLRGDRALVAVAEFLKTQHLGQTACGILRNYLTFRIPSNDSNKSRWEIVDYWEDLLQHFQKISLFISPGSPYNFEHTKYWAKRQYGPFLAVLHALGDSLEFLRSCKDDFPLPDLPPKYRSLLYEFGVIK